MHVETAELELSLPDRVYQHVRARLVSGEYGSGARLDYKKLGAELGISTTPVREAMGKLASEGFVELVPRLGAVVRRLGRREAIELYELRECVEPFAAERAAERISDAHLQQMRGYVEAMRRLAYQLRDSGEDEMPAQMLDQFHQSDYAFHMLILRAVNNRRLEKVMADCHALERIFSTYRHGFNLSTVVNTYCFHRRIYNAMARRDGAAARDWLARHIRHGQYLTISAYDRMQLEAHWMHGDVGGGVRVSSSS